MSRPTTTRRDMLRFGTSAAAYAAGAAIVAGGVALASEAKGAEGVSPELLHLIAAANRANAASLAYDQNVYDRAASLRETAMTKVHASLRHVSADAGEGMTGGRITFTTSDKVSVALAKRAVKLAREGSLNIDDGGEYLRAARQVTAASIRHERAIARVDNAHSLSEVFDRGCALCDASADADEEVANFTPRNMADLRTKLAFMVKHDMGNGIDRLSIMVADIDALSAREG